MEKKRFVGFYNYTVILTLFSLVIATFGVTQCMHAHYKTAIFCLMLAGLGDAFDGRIARRRTCSTPQERSYGVQLDSLCDMVCFGLFPGVICYMLGCRGIFGLLCIFFYVIGAVSRLGFFNVLEEERQKGTITGPVKAYHGLPVTSIAVILPVFFMLQFFVSPVVFYIALHVMLVGVGFAFIFNFSMPKPGLKAIIAIAIAMALCIAGVTIGQHFKIPPMEEWGSPMFQLLNDESNPFEEEPPATLHPDPDWKDAD